MGFSQSDFDGMIRYVSLIITAFLVQKLFQETRLNFSCLGGKSYFNCYRSTGQSNLYSQP